MAIQCIFGAVCCTALFKFGRIVDIGMERFRNGEKVAGEEPSLSRVQRNLFHISLA